VAAHLRAALPGDGEEVTEVIARHYLDALDAVPDAPDAGQDRANDQTAAPNNSARVLLERVDHSLWCGLKLAGFPAAGDRPRQP
jgi:hypothetical protein